MSRKPQIESPSIGVIGVSLRGRILAEEAVNAAPGVSIGAAADLREYFSLSQW